MTFSQNQSLTDKRPLAPKFNKPCHYCDFVPYVIDGTIDVFAQVKAHKWKLILPDTKQILDGSEKDKQSHFINYRLSAHNPSFVKPILEVFTDTHTLSYEQQGPHRFVLFKKEKPNEYS